MAEKGSNQKKYRHNFCRKFKWKISPDATDIWREKNQSLPKSKFPVSFSLSTNPKHQSNTAGSTNLIKEIIIPYIEKGRISLKLPKIQPALLIMDVFREQMTEDVFTVL